ncbi:MAG: sulfotransferase [Bacteroidetes bacterium]|nr:sulfotransferase [Bacteroidota bacterium]
MCAFLSKLLDAPTEPKGKAFEDPIFLLGIMRSGTTLLMNILSEHPQLLKVGFELNKVWTEIGGAPCSETCEARTDEDFNSVYTNNMTSYFTKYIEESKSIKRHLARYSAKRHHGSGGVFYDWDNIRLMNKSPHLSNKVKYIHAMYPNAKFVVIMRSLEGQVSSMKMHFLKLNKSSNWSFYLPNNKTSCWTNIKGKVSADYDPERLFPSNFNLLSEAWLRLNTKILKDLEGIPQDQKYLLSYEELMANQERKLKDVFEFLKLEKQHNAKVEKIIKKNRRIHNTTTKGNPIDKWKKYLDEFEIDSLVNFKNEHESDIEFVIEKFK